MEAALQGPTGRIVLGPTVLTIGRSSDNQLVVNDAKASSRHAEIRPSGQDYIIIDLASANGTFVNEQRLDSNVPRFLTRNDRIRIGDTMFTYEVGTPSAFTGYGGGAQQAYPPYSAPYGAPPTPHDMNPYGLPEPYGVEMSQQPPFPPSPPRPRRRGKSRLVIGILTLLLILGSGIAVFALFAQGTPLLNQIQRFIPNAQTATPSAQTVTPNAQTATPSAQTVTSSQSPFDTSFYYRLTNTFLGPGQSLDVRSDGSYLLKMAPTGNYTGQFWKLVPLGGGKYALRTAYLRDGFSLDVINDGVDKTPRMMATGNYTGQSWSVVPWGDGTYKLTNDFTGPDKALDTSSDTHEPFLGPGDHTGQHWTLTQLGLSV